jgi:hypothetical protein
LDGTTTRREWLARSAKAGAGGVAVATLIGAGAAEAAAPAPTQASPAVWLHRLLSVELLLLYAYEHVLGSSVLSPRAHRILTPLVAHEEAHVRALRGRLIALGQRPPAGPASVAAADRDLARRKVQGRLGELKGSPDAVRLLLALERVVVGAYFVALTKLEDPKLIGLVTQIMAADAQHEAIIGSVLYRDDAQQSVPFGLVQGVQ